MPSGRVDEAGGRQGHHDSKTPWSAVLTTSGVLATWLSHVRTLDRGRFAEYEVDLVLADGTRAGALLFRRAGEAPRI